MKINHANPYLSLVIPVYNDQTRLTSSVYSILSFLKKQSYTWELIFVDDGSDIPVSTYIKRLIQPMLPKKGVQTLPISVYRLAQNMGKGAAIRLGVQKAKGSNIVFSDVDLSVAIHELERVIQALKKHHIVIGSRRLRSSKIVVHQGAIREFSGRIFTWLSNIICQTGVADVTCGFKGYQRDIAKQLFGISQINRWVFDTEIVFLARKHGIPVFELPVVWENKAGSKVKTIDSIQSVIDVIKIRVYSLRGDYDMRPL
jgi:dolichyl-phosphate beta-glucosyltransferase